MTAAAPPVSMALTGILPWVVVAVLALNMSQRRFMDVGVAKRFATLQLGGLVTALWAAALVLERFALPDLFLVPVLVLLAIIAVARRQSIFPHRLRCTSCGALLPVQRILYHDDARCASCASPPADTEERP